MVRRFVAACFIVAFVASSAFSIEVRRGSSLSTSNVTAVKLGAATSLKLAALS